jgi:hypothetical protein
MITCLHSQAPWPAAVVGSRTCSAADMPTAAAGWSCHLSSGRGQVATTLGPRLPGRDWRIPLRLDQPAGRRHLPGRSGADPGTRHGRRGGDVGYDFPRDRRTRRAVLTSTSSTPTSKRSRKRFGSALRSWRQLPTASSTEVKSNATHPASGRAPWCCSAAC